MYTMIEPVVAAELKHFLQAEITDYGIPGFGVAIVYDGQIVHLGGYGLANVEHGAPVTSNTVFHSGSTGKMFTAAALLFLAQDGLLKLDHAVSSYLPEVPKSWADMTIRHLLSMTSGLGNFGDVFAPAPIENNVIPVNIWQDHSDEQLLSLAAMSPLKFAPGESYLYSNISYIVASLIVARITGRPYYKLLRDRLFEPAGMANAREASYHDLVPNRAGGYSLVGGQLSNSHWTAPTMFRTGDGGLYFSARDIAQWFIELDRPKILNGDMIAQMFEPALTSDGRQTINGYGLGWQNSEIRGQRKIRHGGTWDGFRAELVRFPAQRLSVAVLANLDSAQVARIAHKVAGLVDPTVAPHEPVVDVDPVLTSIDTTLIKAIAAGNPPSRAFNDACWQQWSGRWFEQVIAESESELSAAPLELVEHKDKRRCYRLSTGRYHMHWTIDRQSDGRIAAMRFHME